MTDIKRTKIIGLSGAQGSGKDTAATMMRELLENKHRIPKVKTYAYADNLKHLCRDIFDLNDAQLFGDKKNTPLKRPITLTQLHTECIVGWIRQHNGVETNEGQRERLYDMVMQGVVFNTPREIFQHIGTEILRNVYDDNYHVNVLMREIEADNVDYAIITDARFPNERAAINERKGVVFLVAGRVHEDAIATTHKSETSLGNVSDYACVLSNSGTLANLKTQVEIIIGSLVTRGTR